MRLSGGRTCDGYMHFWRSRIQQWYFGNIADAPKNLRHGCRCHQVGTPRTEWPMFLLDPQSVVGLSPGPDDLLSKRGGGGGDSSKRSELVGLPLLEASTVQALMDLALPRFAGLGDVPQQVHLPWSVSSDSAASPAACRLHKSGQEELRFPKDPVLMSSPCFNLDELSSSSDDDDTRGSVSLSDLSITLLCDSDEVFSPVNSDQVLSDVDLPLESVEHDKRQVIRIRDVSPDVLIVDDSQVGRAWDSQRPAVCVSSGKRMAGKVSTAISRAPPSLDLDGYMYFQGCYDARTTTGSHLRSGHEYVHSHPRPGANGLPV